MKQKEIPGFQRNTWFDWRGLRSFATDPTDHLLQVFREHGEFTSFMVGPTRFFLITGPELAREFLIEKAGSFEKSRKDVKILSRMLGRGLVTNVGAFHKQQRKLSQPAFRKKRIATYADAMITQTQMMADQWREGQKVDMAEEMMRLTMYIVTKTLFDMDLSSEAEKVGHAIEVLQEVANKELINPLVLPRWLPLPLHRRAEKAKAYVDQLVDTMIEERRKEEREGTFQDRGDLLSALIEAEDEEGNRMDDQQLRDEVITLFVAGHETTSNALTWTWYLLSQHPEIEQKVFEEVDRVLGGRQITPDDVPELVYTQMVLKESIRLYPPAWILNVRQALEDTTIGGYPLKKDDLVFVSPYVMHRHPEHFAKPEEFDPTHFAPEIEKARHRFAYIPFGAGHRVCIGNAFAMMEATLIIAHMAQHFRFGLQPGQEVNRRAYITMSPSNGLQMTIHKRHPTSLHLAA